MYISLHFYAWPLPVKRGNATAKKSFHRYDEGYGAMTRVSEKHASKWTGKASLGGSIPVTLFCGALGVAYPGRLQGALGDTIEHRAGKVPEDA